MKNRDAVINLFLPADRRKLSIATVAAVTLLSTEESLVLQNSPICMQKFTYKRTGCEKERGGGVTDRHKQSTATVMAATLSYLQADKNWQLLQWWQ